MGNFMRVLAVTQHRPSRSSYFRRAACALLTGRVSEDGYNNESAALYIAGVLNQIEPEDKVIDLTAYDFTRMDLPFIFSRPDLRVGFLFGCCEDC
jgi:hypothetical protein